MIAYRFKDALYLNITNRCTNDCTFCLRRHREGIAGQRLWLEAEPEAGAVLAEIGDPAPYREVVFCGFGEPLLRLDVVKEVAAALRRTYPGLRLRVDTNGLANLVYGRNIVPELVGLIDAVSISLNAPTAGEYERLCRPSLPGAFEAVLDFTREAVRAVPEVTLTAVALPGLDLEACRRLAESLGARFRVRPFIRDEEGV
ncbi:MAG: TatD family nuclease-associated radical SAM protein [Bacillota bacterium]|nr:TatD family nuclease-associated radical SAM protein [Bacillota bacterium]